MQASIPAEPAVPAEAPEGEVPMCWNSIVAEFPFVYSINDKCHKVRVGFPEHPSRWRTFGSWPFGKSDVARSAQSLPACHKSICERCCIVERAAAKATAESRVLEVGGDAHEALPSSSCVEQVLDFSG